MGPLWPGMTLGSKIQAVWVGTSWDSRWGGRERVGFLKDGVSSEHGLQWGSPWGSVALCRPAQTTGREDTALPMGSLRYLVTTAWACSLPSACTTVPQVSTGLPRLFLQVYVPYHLFCEALTDHPFSEHSPPLPDPARLPLGLCESLLQSHLPPQDFRYRSSPLSGMHTPPGKGFHPFCSRHPPAPTTTTLLHLDKGLAHRGARCLFAK